NDFIQLAGETGYVGLLLGLLILLGFCGGSIWWLMQQPAQSHADRMIVISGSAGLLAISGSGFFGFPFHIASSSVMAVVVAGLAGGIWTQARRNAVVGKT